MPKYCHNIDFALNRRDFLGRSAMGLGGLALAGLLNRETSAAPATPRAA